MQRTSPKLPHFSPREIEVVRYTSLGCSAMGIAAILGTAIGTVTCYKSFAFKLLGTGKATLLTRLAIKHKISPLNDSLSPSERRRAGLVELPANIRQRVSKLSNQQIEVVRLLTLGCNPDEIAILLGVSRATACNHRADVRRTLGIDKSILLTRIAIKHKISPLEDRLTESEKRKIGRTSDGWN